MEEHQGSSREIDYTSGVAEPPTQELEKNFGDKNNGTMMNNDSSQDQHGDNDEPYVHDQLPNVEEVRIRAASALTLATDANLATNTARMRSNSSHRATRIPRRSVMKCIFWAGLIFMVVAIIVLIVGIARNTNSGNSNATSLDRNHVEEFLMSQGFATQEELQDESSPQWDAVSWLVQLDGAGREVVPGDGDDTAFFLQRYVMVLLYYATNGPFWTFSRIIADRNTCDWNYRAADGSGTSYNFGAVCNDEGIVNTIFLPETNLEGAIPRELGYLSNLEYLALYNNILKGQLPPELQLLTNLKDLILYGNALTGSIPFWIDQLTLLQVLRLSGNEIEGSLPSAIGRLTNLETLGLDENALEGDIQNLQDLKNMKRLYLSENSFTAPLASSYLLAMRDIEELDLSGNDFDGPVPLDMFRYPNLRILDLGDNRLSGPLPTGPYTEAAALTVLSLANNDITDSIPESIGDLSSLTHLDLAGNEFSGSIPSAIEDMTNLKYLFLSENPFNASTFPVLNRLTNLEDLSLKRTQMTGEIPALTQLTKLVMLDLDGNDLEGEIPMELSQLTSLQYLFLNRNDGIIGDVPTSIQTLPKLKVLLLTETSISGILEYLCNRTESNLDQLEVASADCFGDQKEVQCDCCTICCGDDTTEDEIGDQACLGTVYYGDVDPIWQGAFQREDYSFNKTDGR